jgi:cob(I)alamin adenosyltransferase
MLNPVLLIESLTAPLVGNVRPSFNPQGLVYSAGDTAAAVITVARAAIRSLEKCTVMAPESYQLRNLNITQFGETLA